MHLWQNQSGRRGHTPSAWTSGTNKASDLDVYNDNDRDNENDDADDDGNLETQKNTKCKKNIQNSLKCART